MSWVPNKGYLIETPTGFMPFDGVQRVERTEYVQITLEDGAYIRCSTNHRFQTTSGLVEALRLRKGSTLVGKNGYRRVSQKRLIKEQISLFDPLNVDGGHLFYSADVVSHNCDFVGSTQTLIHPDTLRSLVAKKPVKTNPISILSEPVEENQYIVLVDSAEGVGLDCSSINVIDVSTKVYQQVAAYRNNTIKPHELAILIKDVASLYNNALVFVEDASTGPLVLENLVALEYTNIITLEKIKGKDQYTVKIGRNSKGKLGGKTTMTSKLLACTELKKLIETSSLIINDKNTIAELESYSRTNTSYAAEEGNTDDLVAGLVLFGWLHTLKEFRQMLQSASVSSDGIKDRATTYQVLTFLNELNSNQEGFEAHGMLWRKV